MTDLTRDLTMVRTEALPPDCVHMQFPITELRQYQRMVASHQVTPVGSLQRRGSIYYTTVLRGPQHRAAPATPRWVRPLAGLGLLLAGAGGFIALCVWAVRSLLSGISGVLPGAEEALGFLVAVSLLLFLGVAATRRSGGRTFEGTFKGTIR